jgi:hypothetical protein
MRRASVRFQTPLCAVQATDGGRIARLALRIENVLVGSER